MFMNVASDMGTVSHACATQENGYRCSVITQGANSVARVRTGAPLWASGGVSARELCTDLGDFLVLSTVKSLNFPARRPKSVSMDEPLPRALPLSWADLQGIAHDRAIKM